MMKSMIIEALIAWSERQAEDAIGPSDVEVVIEDIIDIGDGLLRGREALKVPNGIFVRLSNGKTFAISVKEVDI